MSVDVLIGEPLVVLQYEVGIVLATINTTCTCSEFAFSLISLLPHFIFCDVLSVYFSRVPTYIVVRTGTKLQASFVVEIATLA